MYTLLGAGHAAARLYRRDHDAIAAGSRLPRSRYLPPEHYDQIFSAHGTIMIFFVRHAVHDRADELRRAAPARRARRRIPDPQFGRLLADSDRGAARQPFTGGRRICAHRLAALSAAFASSRIPPASASIIISGRIQISGIGTLLTGINLVTTILKMRAPGMSYLRMSMFCWTALATNLLIVAAFPILTATLAMLTLDRYLGFHFFTNEAGGNVMMFVNLIWAWGHPEVYILVLPAFGMFSEVISTFSSKPLFGYRSMVMATMAICIISFMVWLHHFFTMGAGGDVNAVFGIATSIIAVPTGVKVFNWLFTMYGGRFALLHPCSGRSASWLRS